MTKLETIRAAIPKPVKTALQPLIRPFGSKLGSELRYWRNRHAEEGRFKNEHYRKIMLAMANEADEAFLRGKVVADFGCGPRGSLSWLRSATAIGIDVLVPSYAEAFPDDLRGHGMFYVASTENLIPIPSASVDVMFTMNALDHAADLEAICSEIVRVIKPGGELVASFNLNEPPTVAEPNTLTEELLDEVLLRHFKPTNVRLASFHNDYLPILSGANDYVKGRHGHMWFRGIR